MKLNLVPTYVSKGARTRTAVIGSIALFLLAGLACVGMIVTSSQALTAAKARADELKPQADAAVATARQAETIVASSAGVVRNLELAMAMDRQNRRYPDFYRFVTPYIPDFFRVNSLSVEPTSSTAVTLTLTGTIKTYQQYADVMLALYRIPGARTVSRSGFLQDPQTVPAITPEDPAANAYLASQGPTPQDVVSRIQALATRAAGETTGFAGIGNFGAAGTEARSAMPGWSAVQITVQLESDPTQGAVYALQTPVPRTTVASGGGGAAAVAPSPFGGPGGPPPGMGGPMGGAGGPMGGVGGPMGGAGGPGGRPGGVSGDNF